MIIKYDVIAVDPQRYFAQQILYNLHCTYVWANVSRVLPISFQGATHEKHGKCDLGK